MPIGSATSGLKSDIEAAYDNAISNGSNEDNSDGTQRTLGDDMGTAIDSYYVQSLVSTDVTIDAGQPDAVGGTTQTEGTGTGTGSLTNLDSGTLKNSLYNAYKAAAKTGEESDPIPQLAQDVGDAIHVYMTSPTVITTVVAHGGQVTNAPAGLVNPVGTVSTPGAGAGTGTVSFDNSDVATLKSDIEIAYNNAKKNGEDGEAQPSLAADMQAAIHNFALTAIVETDVTIFPGQLVVGYLTLAGTTVIPLPPNGAAPTLITTNASGEGTIS